MLLCMCSLTPLCFAGCSSDGADDARGGIIDQHADDAGPLVPGGVGLELHRWLVRASLAERGQVLRRFEGTPVPMPEAQVARWRACGMRVLAVPMEEVPELRALLRAGPSPERTWLGMPARWGTLHEGSRSDRARTIETDAGPLTLEPGSLRLLARVWARPARIEDERTPAVLRVELLPEASPRRRASLLGRASAERDARLTMPRLLASIESERDVAVLLIPERASVDWSGVIGPESGPAGSIGPPMPEWPTLGDALLGASEDPRTGREERVVIVLVLRVPPRYELLATP